MPQEPFAVFILGPYFYVLDTTQGRESLIRYTKSKRPRPLVGVNLSILAQLIKAPSHVVTFEEMKQVDAAVEQNNAPRVIHSINDCLTDEGKYLCLMENGELTRPVVSQRNVGYRSILEVEFLPEAQIQARLQEWIEEPPPPGDTRGTEGPKTAPSFRTVIKAFMDTIKTLGEYLGGTIEIRRWVALLCALAPFASLILWNVLCKLLGWSFWMGHTDLLSSDVRLEGGYAFVWGIATTLPVIVAARLVDYPPHDWLRRLGRFVSQEIEVVTMYTVLGGIAGFLFYTMDTRGLVESLGWAPVSTEFLLVLLWSSSLSVATAASFHMTYTWPRGGFLKALMLQLATVLFLTVPAVTFFVWLVPYTDDFEQARGLLAHLAMTAGLVSGVVLTLQRESSEPRRLLQRLLSR